jgi:hypothetical protein
VHGEIELRDGATEPLDIDALRGVPESALRWLSVAIPLLAAAALIARLATRGS